MASTQDELYRRFLEVAGRQSAETADTRAMLTDVVAEIREGRNGLPTSATPAPATADSTKTDSTDGGGITAGKVASTFLKSGLGLPALIGGLFGLFGGGDDEAPP